ncbi:hypothetical protein [Nonomuraea sp. NPDC049400]|uniref:hypothetical protein n=1 Tax=Nonomuraea sp. NPDC049400 TaxID=3364352 RepID=UPI0037BAA6C0
MRMAHSHLYAMAHTELYADNERWFGLLTDKLIRRGVHTSVKALENDIKTWIDTWNEDPRPFTWTKTADEILKSLADYLNKINPPTTQNQQRT